MSDILYSPNTRVRKKYESLAQEGLIVIMGAVSIYAISMLSLPFLAFWGGLFGLSFALTRHIDKTTKPIIQLMKSAVLATLCIASLSVPLTALTPIILCLPYDVIITGLRLAHFWPIIALGVMANQPVDAKKSRWGFVRNLMLIILAVLIGLRARSILRSVVRHFNISTKMERIVESLLGYIMRVGVLVGLARVAGFDMSQLFRRRVEMKKDPNNTSIPRDASRGRRKKSAWSTGVQFFIAGMFLWMLPLSLLNPFSWMNNVTLLLSYNYVSLDLFSYLGYQAVVILHVLFQTLYEEIVFRSMLYGALQVAGFAQIDKEGEEKGILHAIGVVIIMSTIFAGGHMLNPVETGRQWLSFLEKFLSYFASGVTYSISCVLTGGIELSWGNHFMNNWYISLTRFDSLTGCGVVKPLVRVTTQSHWVSVAENVTDALLNTAAVCGVAYYMEEEKEEEPQTAFGL